MVGIMCNIFTLSSYKRMVSLILGTYLFCPLFAQQAICAPNASSIYQEYLRQADALDGAELTEKFDQFQESVESPWISVEEGRKFLQAFINEINTKHGMSLTLLEACKLVRENIYHLNIPSNMQEVLLKTIAQLESQPPEMHELFLTENLQAKIYWPTEWNWFGLNKKKHKHKKHQTESSGP